MSYILFISESENSLRDNSSPQIHCTVSGTGSIYQLLERGMGMGGV